MGIYFPSVLVSKPVLDMPRAGRLSAITATTDTCGVENCLLLWDLHQPGHIQREQCCGMQELCPACRQVRLRSTGIFFNSQRKVWWGGLCTDLRLFPHFVYPASHAGPVTLGPNLLPIPIPLEVLFSSQFLSLFNSYCYLFLVFPLLLNCTSLFFSFIQIQHLLFPCCWDLAGKP